MRETVEQCVRDGLGVVQMPCPEQRAWGGVLKPWMLAAVGARIARVNAIRRIALALFVAWTRLVYWRLAVAVAGQIEDYVASGFTMVGVTGIDGSPSCGVHTSLDLAPSLAFLAHADRQTITAAQMNAMVRRGVVSGPGLFTGALQHELDRRHIGVRFSAHDLIAELDAASADSTQGLHRP